MSARAGGARVELTAIAKHYGDRQVLSSIDLTIAPGEFIALVGKSGTGKSTLLRLLAQLEVPSSGQLVYTDPHNLTHAPEVRMMFQEPRLLPWRTVRQNIRLGLPSDRDVTEVLSSVGLADHANDYPHTLSGGQRQRVALARALSHRPKLMLFDEPFGALDALTRMAAQQLVEKLWQEQRFSAVLVTHDVEEAVLLSDRAFVLDQGYIKTELSIELPRPRSRTDPSLLRHRATLLSAITSAI